MCSVVLYLLLSTNNTIVVILYDVCTAKPMNSFAFLYDQGISFQLNSYTKKDKHQDDFFFTVVIQNVIEITTDINEVEMTHGEYVSLTARRN